MKWLWFIPVLGFFGCGNSEQESEEISLENSVQAPTSNKKKSKKKIFQPTYNASAGRRVEIDSKILFPKTEIYPRSDAFALLQDEKRIYQEIKMDELYQKTDGFLHLVKIPEETIVEEAKKKIIAVPFSRLIGTIVSNGIVALVEMNNKKVIEVRPGETVEGWKLNYLDTDQLEFEHIGEGIPKKITITSKPTMSSVKTTINKEKVLDLKQEEISNEDY